MQVRWKATDRLPFDDATDKWTNLSETATNYTATGLTNGTSYTFEVRAVNSAYNGAAASVAATPELSAPSAPTNLKATEGDTEVSLSWDLPTDGGVLIKVQVRYQEKDAATWEAWVDLAANATTYTVTNLENRKTYTFAVRAVNRIGDGEVATVDARPKLSAPEAPTNLSAEARDTEVSLSWDLPTNSSEINNVQVRWKATDRLPFDDATDKWNNLARTATNYTATGLTNGTSYTFEVRAVNSAHNGAAASVAATPVEALPGLPTDLEAVSGDTEVVLLWKLPTNTDKISGVEVRFKEQRVTQWGDWNLLSGTATRFTAMGLTNGTVYEFEVRARNAAGPGPSAKVDGKPELKQPSAPSNLEAEAGNTQVILSWDLPGKGVVDSIDVRYKKKTDQQWSEWKELAGDVKTHTVTGLTNGTTYEFEVRATNTAGHSDSVQATQIRRRRFRPRPPV